MATATLIPSYSTKLFTDIYEDATTFSTDYTTIGLGGITDSTLVTKLFYLLYAKYGNNPIINLDETQFKYKLFSTVFMYGPTWEKRLDMQAAIRQLSLNDLKTGLTISRSNSTSLNVQGSNTGSQETSGSTTNSLTGTTIGNHAYNPSTDPSTQTLTELQYIDQQNVNKDSKSGSSIDSGTVSSSGTNSRQDTGSSTGSEIHTKGILDAYTELWELLDNDVTSDFLAKFKSLFKVFVRPEKRLIFVTDEDDDDNE